MLDRNAQRRYERALTAQWDAADATAREYGAQWYAEAGAFAAGLAERHDLPVASVAGAVAALSPRRHWNENKADAELLVAWYVALRDDPDAPDVPLWYIRRDLYAVNMRQIGKAVDCLGSPDPLGEHVLRGPKERAFCANILGDTSAVTVDVWIYAIATRAVSRKRGTTGAHGGPSPREYVGIAHALTRVAERVGTTPRDFQAAVWAAARGSAS